jgi:hypothetical protein
MNTQMALKTNYLENIRECICTVFMDSHRAVRVADACGGGGGTSRKACGVMTGSYPMTCIPIVCAHDATTYAVQKFYFKSIF